MQNRLAAKSSRVSLCILLFTPQPHRADDFTRNLLGESRSRARGGIGKDAP
jgi:hypothetical protein